MPARYSKGWIRQPEDKRDFVFAVARDAVLPAVVDLKPGCPPVWNQGQTSSCTAHATLAAFLYDSQGRPITMLSRMMQYYDSRILSGDTGFDGGAQIRDSAKAMNKWGACEEDLWPFDADHLLTVPSGDCYVAAKDHRTNSYVAIDRGGLRHALASGYPVVCGIEVYESFETDEVAKTGIIPMPLQAEEDNGGHAILLVGYDDEKQTFTFRNSWGVEWGDGGYGTLPTAYLQDERLSSDFWQIQQQEVVAP